MIIAKRIFISKYFAWIDNFCYKIF